MLTVAVPNKGALSEAAVEILCDAGYRCRRSDRALSARDSEQDVEFIFLRPRDIAIYVGNGTLDVGITGRDLALDSGAAVAEMLALGFGRSRFHYAIPATRKLTPDQFGGLRIATSYPGIVRQDLADRGVEAEVIRLDGAVEISIRLGVADAIADVVESGRTLTEAGLKTVGAPIMYSEAVVVGRRDGMALTPSEPAQRLIQRLQGILVARTHAMIEYDIPKSVLEEACAITPGIEAPTLSPLSHEGWMAVKSMIRGGDVNAAMDALHALGAKGIIVTEIRTCRM